VAEFTLLVVLFTGGRCLFCLATAWLPFLPIALQSVAYCPLPIGCRACIFFPVMIIHPAGTFFSELFKMNKNN
jgi:hypothetical protein